MSKDEAKWKIVKILDQSLDAVCPFDDARNQVSKTLTKGRGNRRGSVGGLVGGNRGGRGIHEDVEIIHMGDSRNKDIHTNPNRSTWDSRKVRGEAVFKKINLQVTIATTVRTSWNISVYRVQITTTNEHGMKRTPMLATQMKPIDARSTWNGFGKAHWSGYAPFHSHFRPVFSWSSQERQQKCLISTCEAEYKDGRQATVLRSMANVVEEYFGQNRCFTNEALQIDHLRWTTNSVYHIAKKVRVPGDATARKAKAHRYEVSILSESK
ncbi:hypothetical protein GOBAR_DD00139 [Gossypium barbadense]|nr:hypothetical protein GOBAR_DD00139 [Gossypium barbadense]